MKNPTPILLLALVSFLAACSPTRNAALDEQKLIGTLDQLRLQMIDPDKAALENIAAATLLYIHSSGKIETKPEFVETLVSGVSDFVTLEFTNLVIKITGDTAIVNLKLTGQTADKGKAPATLNLGVTLVFQNQSGTWKLLARQAYKL